MNKDFAPIGTVCSIKGNSKKVMIISYMYNDFKNGFKTYDYLGIPFPEGLLLPNRLVTFNKQDILNIDFLGYSNEEYKQLNDLLYKSLSDDNNDLIIINNLKDADNNLKTEYIFDKNGLVLEERNVNVLNPFRDNNLLYSEKSNEKKENNNWSSVFEDIQFDENGIVISAKERNNRDLSRENIDIKQKYSFNENGVVISENKEGA